MQDQLILPLSSSLILIFFLIILIISHHTFLCNNAQKNQSFQIDLIINVTLVRRFYLMERVMRIGLTYSAWKADVLPLNYTRIQLTLIIIIGYGFFVNSFFQFVSFTKTYICHFLYTTPYVNNTILLIMLITL